MVYNCCQRTMEKEFIDFDFVINALKKQNKNWFDFGKISSENRNQIYVVISKEKKRA